MRWFGSKRAGSVALTLLVVAALILAGGPAAAVQAQLENPGSVTKGNKKSFDVTIDVENADKYTPFKNVTVNVGSKKAVFDLDGSRLSGSSAITASKAGSWGSYGYGYGYATNADPSGYGYSFGYGYGYGYSGSSSQVTLTVTVDTSSLGLSAGSYDVNAKVKADGATFSSGTKTLKINAPAEEEAGDGVSGAPGHEEGEISRTFTKYTLMVLRAGDTGEADFQDFDSIVRRLMVTVGDTTIDPTFSVAEFVSRPENVDDAGGEVQAYVSITSSIPGTDLDDVEIVFELDGEGLEGRNLVVKRWHDGEWQTLETEVTRTDGKLEVTAKSPGLSVFAVTTTAEAVEEPTPTPEETPEETPVETPPGEETPTATPEEGLGGPMQTVLLIVLVVIVIAAVAIWYSRYRNR